MEYDLKIPAIRGVIAVQNYGISGSTLMQSLLDNHPEILSLPGLYALPLYPFFDEHAQLPMQEILQALCRRYPFWFDRELALTDGSAVGLGLHQMGPGRDQPLSVDVMEFIDAFTEYFQPHDHLPAEQRRRYFIRAVFIAYHAAQTPKRPLAESVWILYPIHSLPFNYAQYMREDFNDWRFIHTVRHPMRNLGSTLRLTATKPDWWMFDGVQRALAQILNDYQMFAQTHRVNGYRPYFDPKEIPAAAIRLEDMHDHSRPLMQAVAKWLGIGWNESLLQSSFNGLSWWNRPESKRVSGFDSAIAQKNYDEYLSPRDRFILEPLMARQLSAWGYAKPQSREQLISHFPWLLSPLSQEQPGELMRRRYKQWCEDTKQAQEEESWQAYRRQEYWKCRRWLFMAWRATLADQEPIIQLLPFEPHAA